MRGCSDRFLDYNRKEEAAMVNLEEWQDRCLCDPRPEGSDQCHCGVLDDFCFDCEKWMPCPCVIADEKYHASKEDPPILF